MQENDTDTVDRYEHRKTVRYRGSVRIQKNNAVLKNSISKDFKLFTIINKRIIIKLSSKQADKQASEHPSGAKPSWSEANVQTLDAITLHMVTARSIAKCIWRSMRMNAILSLTALPCSWDNYTRTELAVKCCHYIRLPGVAYGKSRGL